MSRRSIARRAPVPVVTMLALVLAVTGCGGGTSASGGAPQGQITVFAAASLTGAFTQLGKDFQSSHPGTHVIFNFAGSSALAQQIIQGAPADVFAAANPATMKLVTNAGDALGTPRVFVSNQLVIAVAPGDPKHIGNLKDLTRPGLKVAICAVQVPCGAAARKVLDAAHVTLKPATLEQDVKAALTKVILGEADAALVYRTDTRAASDKVDTVEFPESGQAINDYPVVAIKAGPNPTGAQAFLAFLATDFAQNVLNQAGFQQP